MDYWASDRILDPIKTLILVIGDFFAAVHPMASAWLKG